MTTVSGRWRGGHFSGGVWAARSQATSRQPLAHLVHQQQPHVESHLFQVLSVHEQHTRAAGLKESHVHDVIITKEAPNYQVEQ